MIRRHFQRHDIVPSWRLSIIAISQVGYLAIIDNLAGRPQIIICHVSIALIFQYRWLLLDTLLILRDDRGDDTRHNLWPSALWFGAENMSRCGDVPVDFALLCHNGPYLGDDMHMCALRRLHSMALSRVRPSLKLSVLIFKIRGFQLYDF